MFSNSSAGLFSLPTRYVMVAASRSGSTCAVMRLSSPICSTLSSQASRSLEFGARSRPSAGAAVVAPPSGLTVTFMSMICLSTQFETRTSIPAALRGVAGKPVRSSDLAAPDRLGNAFHHGLGLHPDHSVRDQFAALRDQSPVIFHQPSHDFVGSETCCAKCDR